MIQGRKISNHQPGPWEEVSKEKGIRLVKVHDFKSFFEFVDRGFGDHDTRHLWRGQQNANWPILSKFARTGKDGSDHLWKYRNAVARCTNIEYDISDKNPNAESVRLRLWSLGQHHGLATPLIDWTVYPYVALFFAFAEVDETPTERAVYALDWDRVQHINFSISSDAFEQFKEKIHNPPYDDAFKNYLRQRYEGNFGDDVHLIEESKLSPKGREQLCKWESTWLKSRQLKLYTSQSNDNSRIHHQGGRHILTPKDISVEEWIETHITSCKGGWAKVPCLIKITIPNFERTDVLRSLNKMNVNYLSLFPDFEGAARHCNMALHEQHLMGLREY